MEFINDDYDDEYDEHDDVDDTCVFCGADSMSSSDEKCPYCRDCGGMYAPGTEECDWCPDEKECAKVEYQTLAAKED